jgi:hypothetical protein
MHTTANFSNQSNARRAAKRMIDGGKAPASDFVIQGDADGLFTIHWRTNGTSTDSPPTAASAPSIEAIETEITAASAAADPGVPEALPAARATADTDLELAPFETPRLIAELARRGFRSTQARRARAASAPARTPRRKNAELDAAAARGVMPTKPDVTSHANHHYQKRFDRLAELAAAGDWDAVRAYECNGVNSYAKMVRQYRDRLLASQAASTAAV